MSTLAHAGGTVCLCNTFERYLDLSIEVETDLVDEILQSLSAKLSLDLGKHCLCTQSQLRVVAKDLPMGLNSGEYATFHTGAMLNFS